VLDPKVFKAYDIRGIYPDQLDEEGAYAIGRAYVEQFEPRKIAVGRDMRLSGPSMQDAVMRGAADVGADVLDLGLVGTEMVYFAVGELELDGGIAVTASHNPKEYTGMKIVRRGALPVGGESGLLDVRDRAMSGARHETGPAGTITPYDIWPAFVDRVLSFVDTAAIKPLRVVIDNYPEGQVEEMDAINNPEDATVGTRKVPFSQVLYIERDDFRENPPKQFYRLSLGREVRLRYGYFVTCTKVVKDTSGEVIEVHCKHDPATRGGNAPDGRKVKSTIHWVSATHALNAEVRVYDNLFLKEDPNEFEEGKDWISNLNPNSLEVIRNAKLEPSLANAGSGSRYQFERLGYFCVDPDSRPDALVFNRTVALKDTWAKVEKRSQR